MSPLRDFARPAARRAWVRQITAPLQDAAWEQLARELFAWQYARVPAYRRLCLAHGTTPQRLKSWRDIPAVPQQLFKRGKLFAHGSRCPSAIYETSGTTSGHPGRQHLLRTDIYCAISVEGAHRAGLFRAAPQFHFLTPSPGEAPRSSLSAMFGFWKKAARQTASCFRVHRDRIESDSFRKTLVAQIKTCRPITICGTAFAFVHLIDAWADLPPLHLPRGSRLLETGGFKGRSREISKPELYAQLKRLFDVPDKSIWNEYGMSELSSQAYARGVSGLHEVPPWARVLVCDPATGHEVGIGQRGLVRWIDLANTDSVMALQTLDLAERTRRGFRLIGRLPRTEPRGCSLGAEDLSNGGTTSR
jgi:hypothetical protein